MSMEIRWNRLRIYVSFIHIPLVFRRNLALFAIGALLITTILSASISFLSGISTQELYLGREANVIILAQSSATTPVTGSVPIEFKEVLKSVPGVVAVSPESLGIGVLGNTKESITYRGITSSFFDIQETKVTLSKDFGGYVGIVKDNELNDDFFRMFSQGSIRGVIVGRKLVDDGIINVDIGQLQKASEFHETITLAATLTDVRFDLEIVGIFETGTKLDEEILIPLPLAQSLNGHSAERVTLHRIRINPDVISAERMERLIYNPIDLELFLNFTNGEDFDPNNVPLELIIRTPDGVVIEKRTVEPEDLPTISLSLYIGIYELELRIHDKISVFTALTIGNQSELLATTTPVLKFTWNLEVPLSNHEVVVFWNDEPLPNASVWLRSLTDGTVLKAITNSQGMALFSNVEHGFYRLLIEYETSNLNTTLRFSDYMELNETTDTIRIAGNGQIEVSLINVTSNTLPQDWNRYEVEARLETGQIMGGSTFSENGTATLEVPLGIYEVYLKRDGFPLADRVQEVVIGDDGFNDSERVEFTLGTTFLNVTVTPINSSINLANHVLNVTVFDQLRNKTLVLEKSELITLTSENNPFLVELNASNSLSKLVLVHDMNVSLSNGAFVKVRENASLDLPLGESYQVRFQLKGIFDHLNDSLATLPIEVSSLFPKNLSITLANPSSSSLPTITVFQNKTVVVTTENTWKSIEISVLTTHQINDTMFKFSETFIINPYALYLYEKSKNQPMNVMYGGIVLNKTYEDFLTSFKVGAELLKVDFTIKDMNDGDVQVTLKLPVKEGKVVGYIPALGRINYTLLFSENIEVTFWEEYRKSSLIEGIQELELPPMMLKVVDLDGNPISEASYEIYLSKSGEMSKTIILQRGYSSTDGTIQVEFAWNSSSEYRLLLKLGSVTRDVPLAISYYQPQILVQISIHSSFVELRNPYKFISTSNIFIGDVDAYLNEVFEGSILVLRLTIYVMIGILGILGGFSLLSLVSYPLAQHRRHFNIVRVIGGMDSMVAISTTFQLTALAALMTALGIIIGNIAMIILTKLRPTNISGLIVEPRLDFPSQLIFFLVITVTVAVSSFGYTLRYLSHLTLRGEMKEELE